MKYFWPLIVTGILTTACGSSSSSSDDAAATASTTSDVSKLTINGGSSLSLAGGDTSSAKLKAYEFWVAAKSDCSDPIKVFSNASGKEVDMLLGPEIGSGELAENTYNCIIMVMSDTIKFTPKVTNGVCVAGTEVSLDVFQPRGETYKPTATLPDGTSVDGAVGEQKIAVYISTLSTSTGGEQGGNPFSAPSTATKTNGIKLSSALEVTADTSGTMVMDTSGRVEPNDSECDMQPPQFGFK